MDELNIVLSITLVIALFLAFSINSEGERK
jgi:hypothetical protein